MRNWSEFREESAEGILPLAKILAIMSTPRHREKLSGRYISSAPGYAAAFCQRLREVAGASPFWDPKA